MNFHEFFEFSFLGSMWNKTLGAFAKACKHLDFKFENCVLSRFKGRVTFSHPNVLALANGLARGPKQKSDSSVWGGNPRRISRAKNYKTSSLH